MIDHEWVRQLSQARLGVQGWEVSDPMQVDQIVQHRIDSILDYLTIEAKDACEVYNQYLKDGPRLSVISSPGLLVLLLGSCQIQLRKDTATLHVNFIQNSGFQAQVSKLFDLTPESDPLGDVRWRLTDGELVTMDQLLKLLLQKLHLAGAGRR